MSQPTYDDVNLILRLYEMRREQTMRDARNWFVANCKFKTMEAYFKACPPGSSMNAYARQVTSYWEMVASFVNSGVLNQDLFFENSRELLLCWLRMKPLVAEIRAAYKDPKYLANLEKTGEAYIQWMNKTSGEEAAQAFAARVGA